MLSLESPEEDSYSSQMKATTLTETKNQLSVPIDQVRHGGTILILDRGRPVARWSSVLADDATASDGRVARLERQGFLRRGTVSKSPDLFREPRPRPRKGTSILEALLEERRPRIIAG